MRLISPWIICLDRSLSTRSQMTCRETELEPVRRVATGKEGSATLESPRGGAATQFQSRAHPPRLGKTKRSPSAGHDACTYKANGCEGEALETSSPFTPNTTNLPCRDRRKGGAHTRPAVGHQRAPERLQQHAALRDPSFYIVYGQKRQVLVHLSVIGTCGNLSAATQQK